MYQEPATRETPDLDPELDTADPGTLRLADSGGTGEQGKICFNSCRLLSVLQSIFIFIKVWMKRHFVFIHIFPRKITVSFLHFNK